MYSRTNRRLRTRTRLFIALMACLFASLALLQQIHSPRRVGAAAFTAGNVVVYRVGDGSGALASTATAVFLDEYTPAGVLVQTIALPTSVSGLNKRVLASGTATSEGFLTRSTNGQYLMVTGYDAPAGNAVVTVAATAANRVIARVDTAGNIDSTTSLTDSFGGSGSTNGNIRSATSTNGTDIWVSGQASAAAGAGIRYTTLGSTTATQLNSTVTNLRATNISGGQLYVSSASGTTRLATVGAGTPTASGQTLTNLPGITSANVTGPYAFFFADLTGAVAGEDTLYIADEGASQIKKFSLVGGTWTANGNIALTNVRGITGVASGSNVTLYASSNGATLRSLTDTSGYNATITGSPITLATAGANTAFRGVALAPASGPPPPPALSINNVTQDEGNGGATTFTFTVTVSPVPAGVVTFDIATADDTAQDGNPSGEDNDYVAKSETGRTIVPPANSATFTVTVNGDTTPEPDEKFFVNLTNVSGATVADGEGVGTITNEDFFVATIAQIQGSGASSPYAGQTVITSGVVTARKSNGFFIQEPDATVDGNPATSEGIFIFTPATVSVGDLVMVKGPVTEFNGLTEISPTAANVTVNSTGNTLPDPIVLTTTILDPAGTTDQLERYEGMRMHADILVSVAPTNNFGETFTVLFGVARPMREPGIEISLPVPPDPTTNMVDCCIPRWDENPERIMIDSDGLAGASVISVTSNVTLTNVTGPLDYNFGDYKIDPEMPPSSSPNMSAVPVPTPVAGEFTVAGYNIENFNNNATQRHKAALAICDVLHTPDVIGHVEIFELSGLQALATEIQSVCSVQYSAHLIESDGNSGDSDQDVGFLVKTSRVQVNSVTQKELAGCNGTAANCYTYTDPTNGQPALLNDRPPLVLRATVDPTSVDPQPVIIVVNHLRSFIDIELLTSEGQRVRAKRKAQSEFLANLLQDLQTDNPGVPVISVGDYNAYQFNDGYTDPVATIKGTPTSDDQVVVDASSDVVFPDYINLVDGLPADQRYSFIFEGTPQALDHVIINTVANSRLTRFAIARNNADFPELPSALFAGNSTRPERNSDHDMPVAYFLFPPDQDNDGIPDATDNCVTTANPDQANNDNDALGDACDPDDDNDGVLDANDNCQFNSNTDQANNDGDAEGDVCDADDDNDGVPDVADNCPLTANGDQANNDGDAEGDVCDADDDNDGVLDANDNCPFAANSDQANNDGDAEGDVCDADDDNDGVPDANDNCPLIANSNQANNDGDAQGDVCDADDDNDGVPDANDNCPFAANSNQANNDGDAEGDVCDADDDNDGVPDATDNCPTTYNPDQADTDHNGIGDACTAFQFPAGGAFVIGDNVNLSGGATVYFWGSQWSQNNPMSGGSAPNAFKGFEGGNASPTCGGNWTTDSGNSSNPPSTVPQYMAVIVSSLIQGNGSTISGNIKKIVVVQTNPGYGPSPGNSGTGQVVAVICVSGSSASFFINQDSQPMAARVPWLNVEVGSNSLLAALAFNRRDASLGRG